MQLSDSNFICTGYITIGTFSNVYISKVSKSGVLIWYKTISANKNFYIKSSIITSDSNIVIVGSQNGFSSSSNLFVMKADLNGTVIWSKLFGSAGTDGQSVAEMHDGSILISGMGSSNILLLNIDASGNLNWGKNIGLSSAYYGYNTIKVLPNDDILLGSYKLGIGPWITKLNSVGTVLWSKYYTLANVYYLIVWNLDYDVNGDIVVSGMMEDTTTHVAFNPILMKTDSAGNFQWLKHYPSDAVCGECYKTKFCSNHEIISAIEPEHIPSLPSIYRCGLFKTDNSGNVLFGMLYRSRDTNFPADVIQTLDEGFAEAGFIQVIGGRNLFFVKTDNNGNSGGCQDSRDTILTFSAYSETPMVN